MPAGYQRRGAPTLLFDRLISREPSEGRPGRTPPGDVYDPVDVAAGRSRQGRRAVGEELRASIAEQLGWLLNTRVPIDFRTLDERTRRGTRTTVDYGLPDLTVYPVGDPEARDRLCAHIAQTVAWYEPRLADPRAAIVASEARGGVLVVAVAGTVTIGLVPTPVRFEIGVQIGEGGENGH